MKSRDFLVTLLGGTCILSGLSILGSYYYFNKQMELEVQKNIESSVIIVDGVEKSSPIETVGVAKQESTLVELDTVIDSLNDDQTIKQVETYTNVLEIPSLDIKAYINEGSDKKALAGGVGRHTKTSKVGEAGNCVIAGHASVTYKCIFNRLEEIDILDDFYAYDSNGTKHKYYVVNKFICDPGNTSILFNSGEGISTITLYTCTNKGHQRFVVVAKEFSDEELEQFKADLKDKYTINMVTMNDSYSIESVTNALAARQMTKHKLYSNIVFLSEDVSPINSGLYGVALGENAFDKTHEYTVNYSMSLGFNLSEIDGGKEDDVSED